MRSHGWITASLRVARGAVYRKINGRTAQNLSRDFLLDAALRLGDMRMTSDSGGDAAYTFYIGGNGENLSPESSIRGRCEGLRAEDLERET